MPWTGIDGAQMRTWRLSHGWDELEMARQLRKAAPEGEHLPEQDILVKEIHRWESGRHAPRWRYRLLYLRIFAPRRLDGEAVHLAARFDALPGEEDIRALADAARANPARVATDEEIDASAGAAVAALREAAARLAGLADLLAGEGNGGE